MSKIKTCLVVSFLFVVATLTAVPRLQDSGWWVLGVQPAVADDKGDYGDKDKDDKDGDKEEEEDEDGDKDG